MKAKSAVGKIALFVLNHQAQNTSWKNIKPGDHLKIVKWKRRVWAVLKFVLIIVFLPLIIVFYLPCTNVMQSWRASAGCHLADRLFRAFCALIFALILNSCFIPLAIMFLINYVVYAVLYIVLYILTLGFCFKICRNRGGNDDIATRN